MEGTNQSLQPVVVVVAPEGLFGGQDWDEGPSGLPGKLNGCAAAAKEAKVLSGQLLKETPQS